MNCYKVFMGTGLIAVVGTEQAALNLINMFIWHAQASGEQVPQMSYDPAFVPGIGF